MAYARWCPSVSWIGVRGLRDEATFVPLIRLRKASAPFECRSLRGEALPAEWPWNAETDLPARRSGHVVVPRSSHFIIRGS